MQPKFENRPEKGHLLHISYVREGLIKMNTSFRIGLILLLTTGLVKAEESDTNTNDLTLLQLVQEAGFLAWPLAALSIAAVFLIIFYTLTVR